PSWPGTAEGSHAGRGWNGWSCSGPCLALWISARPFRKSGLGRGMTWMEGAGAGSQTVMVRRFTRTTRPPSQRHGGGSQAFEPCLAGGNGFLAFAQLLAQGQGSVELATGRLQDLLPFVGRVA